jgi:hypothetical protein
MRKTEFNKPRVNEGLADLAQRAEQDHEVQMARAELYKLAKYSIKLHEMLKGIPESEGLEGWVQSKITKAADYLGSVYHHLEYEQKFEEQNAPTLEGADYKHTLKLRLQEKAVSKAQQQAAGIALAAKRKGETPKGDGAAAQMADMSKKDLEDFASTKHKGLPNKKTDESDFDVEKAVDDQFASGAVADTLGFSVRGEILKAFYRALKAIMPDASDDEIKAKAQAAAKAADQSAIKDKYLKKES